MKKFLIFLIAGFYAVSIINAQWNVQYTSNPSQTVMCLKFFDNNTGYHSGILYNSSTMNIYRTTNGGLNYTAQNSNYTAQRFMSIFMMHPDTVFISGNYGKILRTVNGGTNWIPYVYSDTTVQFWGLFFVNSLTGFASGSAGKILKTTNKGDNWITLTTPTSTALDGIYFVNENTGYVGGANVFLKTTNAGSSWVNKVGSFISPFETAEAVYFSDVNTGYYCTNTSNCRIVKTTDGGDTWNLIHSNEGIGAGWGMSFTNAMTGYVCTGNGKVLKTTDAGITWGIQNTPLTENLYEIHFPSANTGYIASWSGKILKTTNGGLTFLLKNENETVNGYKLEQNFPNPFNPSTKIKFTLPENGFTTLYVYDVTGRKVSALLNEILEKGSYDLTFNACDFSAGIYFYTLTSNSFKQTKKMALMK
jgi:photosystem II stability/assembly factor-like uncharacterized protein